MSTLKSILIIAAGVLLGLIVYVNRATILGWIQ